MNKFGLLAGAAALAVCGVANASVLLVQTSDPGFYNHSIGTSLNNTNGGNTSTGYFPTTNDSSATFTTAPDLSTASGALGNWLSDPAHLNANWAYDTVIPSHWTIGTEVAVIYQFDTLGATNVVAKLGVDNGIYMWLDGAFVGGARASGGVSLGEYSYNLGNLSAGTHYLQLLLEDHGGGDGYAVNVSADSVVTAVPEPGALSLFAAGLVLLMVMRLRGLRASAVLKD